MAHPNSGESTPRFAAHETKRSEIARAGRLHWFHWLVLAFSLVVTIGASLVTKAQIDEKSQTRFDRQSEQAISLILERLEKYEDALWGGVASIEANDGDMDYEQWRTFADSLDLDHRYPGINGIGVIHRVLPEELDDYLAAQRSTRPDYEIHPTHDEELYLPISYIEPSELNAAAVGLDMAHETNRYDGVKRAREFGVAQMTGPIVLVQDEQQTPGFLFYAPWYDGGDPFSVPERRANFAGTVYAPFVVQKLMDGALDKADRDVGISIVDSGTTLYDEHTADIADFDPDPLFREEHRIPVYGRLWTFDIWSTQSFRADSSSSEPLTILLGGLLLDGLLFVLFTSLTRANRRALVFTDEVTEELRHESRRLEASNAELERFAYVASHDLKTPLRGIANITDFLREDLADYLASNDANPDISRNLDRISDQSQRMNALINGVLEYSRIGGHPDTLVETLDVHALLDQIASDVGIRREQIVHDGPESFDAPAAIYFEQVLQNLVGNAAAHHDDPENLVVHVTHHTSASQHTVSVADNGPGIAPQYYDRIFEVFQRLEVSGSGTGIGLSIVKKIVEGQGHTIELSSEIGRGATFTFGWPVADQPVVSPPHRRERTTSKTNGVEINDKTTDLVDARSADR